MPELHPFTTFTPFYINAINRAKTIKTQEEIANIRRLFYSGFPEQPKKRKKRSNDHKH